MFFYVYGLQTIVERADVPTVVNSAVQSQKAVSAYYISKQIMRLGFAEQNWYVDK